MNDQALLEIIGRKPTHQDLKELERGVKGKVVMVTGAAGSIGSDLVRLLKTLSPKQLICIDWWENGMFYLQQSEGTGIVYKIADVKGNKIDQLFHKYRPELVFHAAAYKHVPLMQENPIEAFNNNVLGSMNVMQTAARYGTEKFVLVSTDKAVNPTNVMGATKRLCEIIMEYLADKSDTKFNAVRFGNVIQSNGSVLNTWLQQIANKKEVTVTHKNIKRYFMLIREATELIVLSSTLSLSGEKFLLDMGEPVSIYKLAQGVIEKMKSSSKIKIIGLRSGEKMFEELSYNAKTMEKTDKEGIFIVKNKKEFEQGYIIKAIKDISRRSLHYQMSDAEMIAFLRNIGFSIKR